MRDRLIELLDIIIQPGEKTLGDLADYLLENGVIVPPVKVGDRVYQTDGVMIYESTIDEITYYTDAVIYYTSGIAFDDRAIGDSIFLTRGEAEQALKGGATDTNVGDKDINVLIKTEKGGAE